MTLTKRHNLPRELGDYLVLEHIATGGFGVVLRGLSADGQDVAIKIPHLSWLYAKTHDELELEAKVLQELDHHRIVRYLDSGWYRGNWFIVTQWVQGGCLAEALDEVCFPLDQTIEIIRQVAEALEFGHRQGVVHRDIKPRNIMLHGHTAPHVKVLDYGLAKLLGPDKVGATTAQLKGTPEYIAPEQLQGKCDFRSDIYSLGIVFSDMLRTRYRDSRQVPRPVHRILRKAVHRVPDKRYQSVTEMLNDLCQVQQLIEARKLSVRPRRLPQPVAAMLVACLCLATMLASALNHSPVRTSTLPQPVVFNPSAPLATFFDEAAQPMIWLNTEPPGADVYFYTLENGEPRQEDRLYLGKSPINRRVKPGDYFVVVFWPDGRWHEVLRRIPVRETTGVLPIHRMDAFGATERGLKLATIKAVDVDTSDMIQHNGIWIDQSLVLLDETDPRPYNPSKLHTFSHDGMRVKVKIAEAASHVEKVGKRLPFLSEIIAAQSQGVSANSINEWTATFVGYGDTKLSGVFTQFSTYQVKSNQSKRSSFALSGNTRHREDLGFRGVRSVGPFPLGHK